MAATPKAVLPMPCRPALYVSSSKLGLSLTVGALSVAALLIASPVLAQPAEPPTVPDLDIIAQNGFVEFEADEITYDEKSDLVTATGNVLVSRGGQRLTADTVVYFRGSGIVEASGNVLVDSGDGVRAVADRFELNETLRDGAVENILLVLKDGARVAAQDGVRQNGRSTLNRAAYSPCAVIDSSGCPTDPVWSIKAVRVIHDPVKGRVSYRKARLEMFGVPLVALPELSHPDSFDRNQSGILSPDIRISRELGLELSIPYFWSIAPDRDLTASAFVYTEENPVVGLEYRQLLQGGPVQIGGRFTYAGGQVLDVSTGEIIRTSSRFRGYIDGRGQIAHGNGWRSRFSTRLTNDDNFLGRYQISLDTRLRSNYALEHFAPNHYFSVQGWAFQGLTSADKGGTTPFALPLVDFVWRPAARPLGGQLLVQANSLGLYRSDGQSMNRALAAAQWDRSIITGAGQRITATGLLRGDLYNTRNSDLADSPIYAGTDGWSARVIPLAAIEVDWPLSGPFLGGSQTITPRLQLVASTKDSNTGIPNEDSRAIDLEEANLFALNRFPGFDRWEGGARITYGAEWRWARPRLVATAQFGQSYRLDDQAEIYPEGTGLSDRFSDIVGRVGVRFGRLVEVTQRLRVDKDSLAVRRNETDVAVGNQRTFVSVGYLKFNRNIGLEDLADHEEIRAGARIAFATYWSVFGSAVVDLTSSEEDPLTQNDGWQPIRHRVGIGYRDECFDFGVTWKRNYVDNPNARKGNTFLLTLSLKTLG